MTVFLASIALAGLCVLVAALSFFKQQLANSRAFFS
jgi:hypothetical protein